MTEVLVWRSMDWFLYDKDLRHERVKQDAEIWKWSLALIVQIQKNVALLFSSLYPGML